MCDRYFYNGASVPIIGFGTSQVRINNLISSVECALTCGYRHIDCAYDYENEAHIGAAFKDHFKGKSLFRRQIFISSKLGFTFHHKDKVFENCIKSLHALNLEYLDLYLIDWPTSLRSGSEVFPLLPNGEPDYDHIKIEETWASDNPIVNAYRTNKKHFNYLKGMEQLVRGGLVRSIGLANFNRAQILRILECCDIPPAVLQVESHPYFLNEEIINFAHGSGMQVASYAPLGFVCHEAFSKNSGVTQLLDHPVVAQIAKVHGKSAAQVLIRFAVQRNLIAIQNVGELDSIKKNIEVFDFDLSSDEMEHLYALNKNQRTIDPVRMRSHPEYPFKNECSQA